MNLADLTGEILATYRRHGWKLRRALVTEAGRLELTPVLVEDDQAVKLDEASFNAVWLSRPSHDRREAWELRLLSENPYALFETFAADEEEEARETKRKEMEQRMANYGSKAPAE